MRNLPGRNTILEWSPEVALLALAAALRLSFIEVGWLGVDQARDLAWAERIAQQGVLPEAGPLMRSRLHLGATYYFFWSLPALVAPGPHSYYLFAGVLGVLAVAAAGWLGSTSGGRTAGRVAMLWLATAPTAVLDSRIGWAPAALPLATAAVVIASSRFLREPTVLGAGISAFLAAFATQLHLAAAALAPVAALAVFSKLRAIGLRGTLVAAVCALLPFVPMAMALRVPVPVADVPPAVPDPMRGRIGDFLRHDARWLEGLSPSLEGASGIAQVGPIVELIGGAVPLLAWAGCVLGLARGRAGRGVALLAAAFAACTFVPLALPAEVWGYYLDGALVPGAALVGVIVARAAHVGRAHWRACVLALVGSIALARTLVIAEWIHGARARGFVAVNQDYLRVGGPRPADPGARARLLGFGVKEEAARALVVELGIPYERLWRDVHGPAFGDLDTDNGYVLGRAPGSGTVGRDAEHPDTAPSAARERLEAVLLYAGELDPDWLSAFPVQKRAGPLDIFAYRPLLRTRDATLASCGGGPVPAATPPAPLDYGGGQKSLPTWPCSRPVVLIPFDASPSGVVVRVFPWVGGAAEILGISADPGGEMLGEAAPGLAQGVRIGPTSGTLAIRLAIDGPALLDVVELHGNDSTAGAREGGSDGPRDAGAGDQRDETSRQVEADAGGRGLG